MEKLLLLQVAATLTQGVISNLPDELTVDADIHDPKTQAENLMAWEVFRIFYHGILKALDDNQSWPAPSGGITNLLGGLLDPSKLLPLVQGVLGKVMSLPK